MERGSNGKKEEERERERLLCRLVEAADGEIVSAREKWLERDRESSLCCLFSLDLPVRVCVASGDISTAQECIVRYLPHY